MYVNTTAIVVLIFNCWFLFLNETCDIRTNLFIICSNIHSILLLIYFIFFFICYYWSAYCFTEWVGLKTYDLRINQPDWFWWRVFMNHACKIFRPLDAIASHHWLYRSEIIIWSLEDKLCPNKNNEERNSSHTTHTLTHTHTRLHARFDKHPNEEISFNFSDSS